MNCALRVGQKRIFLRGALAYINEDYDNAALHFNRYLGQPESNTRRSRRREVEDILPELTFLQQYHAHADRPAPVPFRKSANVRTSTCP